MISTRRFLPVILVLILASAACGDDSEPATTTAATPTTAPSTLPPEEPASPAGVDRSEELLGRWDITNYTLPDGGGFTNVVGDDPVFIEFNADGTADYNTGCNSGDTEYVTSGTYYVPESALDDMPAGQSIGLGPVFAQTERGCDGFLGDQDRDLPDAMGQATRFVLDEDRLILLDEFLLLEAVRSG
ncbi:MAG: META domain-containing protein [Acidimicrobiia bacterium]|nr:META domain-containing protein [Acidimicrobiia bacterium]